MRRVHFNLYTKKCKFKYEYVISLSVVILIGSFSLSQSGISNSLIFSRIFNGTYRFLPYILLCIYIIMRRQLKNSKTLISFLSGILMLIFLIVLSALFMLINGKDNPNLVSGIQSMLYPMLIGYLAFAQMDHECIDKTMILILIISFGAYIYSIGGVTAMNWATMQTISFESSYSPYESNGFTGIATPLAAYFIYYRKHKFAMIISVLFALMTFKRGEILITLILLFLSLCCTWKDNQINWKIIIFTVLGVEVATILYSIIMNPAYISLLENFLQSRLNTSAYWFTMGRNSLYDDLLNSGFISSGLDSTWLYSQNIEMDLVKLLLEVGPLGVGVVILYFGQYAKSNWYAYVYMIGVFVNLLTSHSLHTVAGWVLRYILILSLMKYKSDCPIIQKRNFCKKKDNAYIWTAKKTDEQ